MNKILLLFLVLMGVVAGPLQAQNLTVKVGDKLVQQGETILSNHFTIEEAGIRILKLEPQITVTSSTDAHLTITAYDLGGQGDVNFCWPDGCIKISSSGTKKEGAVSANTEVNLLIDYELMFFEDEVPKVTREIKLVVSNGTEEISFQVKMSNDQSASISTLSTKKRQVTPIEGGLAFEVESPSVIHLYALTGRKVAQYQVKGTGTLLLPHLQKGMYVFRVMGANEETGRFFLNSSK